MSWRFNAVDYHYLGSHYREGGVEVWKIRHVLAYGERESTGGVQASWDDAKTAFATYWEDPIANISGHCWQHRPTVRMWLMTPLAMCRWCG